ncbi:MAG: dolichyl-phosphate-mannose-protein mannosyltransferase [Actinomycetota bacterium]|nr:dolichyl-phosphate-mannose-protein mannosyltransferase [Actinomycetota bacterium]
MLLPTVDRARVRERLTPPMPTDVLWGWLGPLLITAVAGVLRFWNLGRPKAFIFDETYYAKDAWSLLHFGVEQDYIRPAHKGDPDPANVKILAGNLHGIWTGDPSYVVHPPGGKWMIAIGEKLFGFTPFGWRFVVAVTGTLAVLMVARIGRRLFRSTLLGCVAGLLLTVDGLEYVHSRTALLDPLLMFWALAAFGALVVDRDRTRARLAARLDDALGARFGPGLGLRPWRLAAGLCLGAACATKWSGLYFVAAFGLMTLLWDMGARRTAGVRRPWIGALVRDALPAFASLVLVALGVYLASWTGWFLGGNNAYLRYWAKDNPGPGWLPDSLWSLWHYHHEAWSFHTHLESFHPYRSNPWGWLVLSRPVSYYYESPTMGHDGCMVDTCSQAITALGTPAIWWAACLALPVLLFQWAGRRDWRAGAILAGVVGGYLPWFFFQHRTIYSFYAVAFVPFLVLAVTMCLGMVLGGSNASALRRQWGAAAVGAYLLLAVANFAWLLPVLSAETIPYADWARRMWWKSWI